LDARFIDESLLLKAFCRASPPSKKPQPSIRDVPVT
jgi:hypothetical protein